MRPLILLLAAVAGACAGDPPRPSSAPSPGAEPAAPGAPTLAFTAQPGWVVETPASAMRVAQYRLPAGGSGAGDASLVVFHFGPRAGTLEANLERWASQFEQPDGGDSEERMQRRERTLDGRRVVEVELAGTYVAETAPGSGERVREPDWRLLAAVIESDAGPYYAKLVGPDETVSRWKASFGAFLEAVR